MANQQSVEDTRTWAEWVEVAKESCVSSSVFKDLVLDEERKMDKGTLGQFVTAIADYYQNPNEQQ